MDLEQLLTLQGLDTRITQLEHRKVHDQTHAALAAAEEAVKTIAAEELVLFARRDTVRHEQKRLEDESATVAAKIAKDTGALYDGSVSGHKDLESLQTEIAHLKDRMSGFDDGAIEQMELAEPLDAAAEEIARRKESAAESVEGAKVAVTIMLAEVGAEYDQVSAERTALAAGMDAELIAQYDKLRIGLGGQGAARLAPGGLCEGCHLSLPSAEYAELKRSDPGEVHLCPECGRILVR